MAAALQDLGHQISVEDWRKLQVAGDGVEREAVIIRSTWDYHLYLDDFLRWSENVNRRALLINPMDCLRWNAVKNYLLADWCAKIPKVPSFLSDGPPAKELLEAALDLSGEAILKPIVGASSFETHRVRSVKQALEAWQSVRRHSAVLVQPFLPWVAQEGEVSVICWKEEGQWQTSHAVRKLPRSGDFRVQKEFGGSYSEITPQMTLATLVAQTLAALPVLPFYARLDFLPSPEGFLLSEVELIEPALFFPDPAAIRKFARAIHHFLISDCPG